MTSWSLVGVLACYFTLAYVPLLWLAVGLGKSFRAVLTAALGLAVGSLLGYWVYLWVVWQGWLTRLIFGGTHARSVLMAGSALAAALWMLAWLVLVVRSGRSRLRQPPGWALALLTLYVLPVLAGGVVVTWRLFQIPRPLQISRYRVMIPNLPARLEGMSLLQVSDIHHLPASARLLADRMAPLAALHPDLVVATGDLAGGSRDDLRAAVSLVRAIPARAHYGVEGNHEVWGFGAGSTALQQAGLAVLHNRAVRLAPGVWLAGTGDPYCRRADLSRALAGIPPGDTVILLCHSPQAARAAAHRGVTLMLCGHTHGGLVSVPGLGMPKFLSNSLVTGGELFGTPYIRGWYRVGKMMLYVNRGVAGRYRLDCPPEAALFTLHRAPGGRTVTVAEDTVPYE